MFYSPSRTFELIFSHRDKLKFGFYAFMVPAIGYTLFYTMAWFAGGAPSTFKPWLALSVEDYFWYGIFLTLPGYYLSWIGASVTIYLLSKVFKRECMFDDVLVVIGFGIGVATWSSLLHDLIDAFLAFIGVIDIREYEQLLNQPTFWRYLLLTLYGVYFFWFITLFTIGIKIAQKISFVKALVAAFIGMITFQIILLIFIR